MSRLLLLSLILTLTILTAKSNNHNECLWWMNITSTACHKASQHALNRMSQYLHEDGTRLHSNPNSKPRNPFHYEATPPSECILKRYGEWMGYHYVCDNVRPAEGKPCVMYSYGVSNDWTFEEELNNNWICRGLLFDPSVFQPAILNEKNTFFSIGANMLDDNEQGGAGARMDQTTVQRVNIGGVDLERIGGWLTATPFQLMSLFNHQGLDLLKMDCEGCEFAIIRDMLKFGYPRFFQSVQQFTFEAHLSQNFMRTSEHAFYLGMLFHVLFKEGFDYVYGEIGACAPEDESKGCHTSLTEVGYLCEEKAMCHEYLFAKLDRSNIDRGKTDGSFNGNTGGSINGNTDGSINGNTDGSINGNTDSNTDSNTALP